MQHVVDKPTRCCWLIKTGFFFPNIHLSGIHLDINPSLCFQFSPPEPVVDTDPNAFYLLMSNSDGYKHIHRVANVSAVFCRLSPCFALSNTACPHVWV